MLLSVCGCIVQQPLLSSSSPSAKIAISAANSNAGTCSSPHLTPTVASLSFSTTPLLYSEKSNSESTHPCLRPVVTSKGSLRTSPTLTSHASPLYSQSSRKAGFQPTSQFQVQENPTERPQKVAQVDVCHRSEHRSVHWTSHQLCAHYCLGAMLTWENAPYCLQHVQARDISLQHCREQLTGVTPSLVKTLNVYSNRAQQS